MKTISKNLSLLLAIICFSAGTAFSQSKNVNFNFKTTNQKVMKTYVIERNLPGAGQLTAEQLKEISRTSCGVLNEMGDCIKWIHSYVTGEKIFCIYQAENEELVRQHAQKGKFPCNNVYEVANIISPATAGN